MFCFWYLPILIKMTSIKLAKVLYLKRSENSLVRNIISMMSIRIIYLHFIKQLFKACFGRENRNFCKVFFVKCFYRLLQILQNSHTLAYSQPIQIFKIELFLIKMFNSLKMLTIPTEGFILDVWLNSEYASAKIGLV